MRMASSCVIACRYLRNMKREHITRRGTRMGGNAIGTRANMIAEPSRPRIWYAISVQNGNFVSCCLQNRRIMCCFVFSPKLSVFCVVVTRSRDCEWLLVTLSIFLWSSCATVTNPISLPAGRLQSGPVYSVRTEEDPGASLFCDACVHIQQIGHRLC